MLLFKAAPIKFFFISVRLKTPQTSCLLINTFNLCNYFIMAPCPEDGSDGYWVSLPSSSPSSSKISVCTAGSPQLFMHEDGGWIFKSLLKVEVKQKADLADWEQRAVKWHTPSLNGNVTGESKTSQKPRDLQSKTQTHIFLHIPSPVLSDFCPRLRSRPCRLVRGQACWVRGCSDFQRTAQGVTWLQK